MGRVGRLFDVNTLFGPELLSVSVLSNSGQDNIILATYICFYIYAVGLMRSQMLPCNARDVPS